MGKIDLKLLSDQLDARYWRKRNIIADSNKKYGHNKRAKDIIEKARVELDKEYYKIRNAIEKVKEVTKYGTPL